MVSTLRRVVSQSPAPTTGFFTFVEQGDEPVNDDHGRMPTYPPGVGSSDFTISRWVRFLQNATFDFGLVGGGGDPNNNWASEDPTPPTQPDTGGSNWWIDCNFIEDGYSNDSLQGSSFGLSLYGSGRARWTIADGTNFYAVQAAVTATAPNIVDNLWHLVSMRRTLTNGGADTTFELLIDGVVTATLVRVGETVNFETVWSGEVGQQTSNEGLYIGCEKLAAANLGAHFPDMKGDYRDLSWWNVSVSTPALLSQYNNGPGTLIGTETGLVSLYPFTEGSGTTAADSVGSGANITMANILSSQWTP